MEFGFDVDSLYMCLLNSDLCKIRLVTYLPERNYCLRRKESVCRLCTDYCAVFDIVLAA